MPSRGKCLSESSAPQRSLKWQAAVTTSSLHAPCEMPVTPNLGHSAANTAPAEIPQRQLPVGLWPPAISSRQDTVRKADVISGAKTQFQFFIPKWLPRGCSLQRWQGGEGLAHRGPPQRGCVAELALSLQAGSLLFLNCWHRPSTQPQPNLAQRAHGPSAPHCCAKLPS